VGLEVTTEGIRTGTSTERWRGDARDGGIEFRILGAAMLKLQAPNAVWTNGAERRLVLESLRERVE